MKKPTIICRLGSSVFKHVSNGRIKNTALILLLLVPIATLSGCISRSIYNRDMSKLLNKIAACQQEFGVMSNNIDASNNDRAKTLNKLTTRYMKLQDNHSKLLRKYNHFDKDLNEFSHDIAELRLVINKNTDTIRSSMTNEMLIKIIDMEFRVNELRKKDAEEPPQLPAGENDRKTVPATQPVQ